MTGPEPEALAPEPEALVVDDNVAIPRTELSFRASRAGGPGGQHVNTSSTRVELRWNVRDSRALDDARRAWLLARPGARRDARMDADGAVRVVASEHRSQRQNRVAAELRLAELVRRALVVPKARRATKPSRAQKAKRLDAKRKQSQKKRDRRQRGDD